MIPVTQAFAASYAQARVKFLEAAAAAGTRIESLPHPLPGREGEALALDVARDGPADADRLLILSSACHGVEGHGGSGVQVAALHDAEWRAQARAQGVAVLYLHALNPHGFSFGRRVTHEGVDLNRNFVDFTRPLPVNADYRELHAWLLPERWPPGTFNQLRTLRYLTTRGKSALQAAITRGQYEFPGGLFFGGFAPSWSNLALRRLLREQGRQARRIAWIDLHTGLGPNGVGERIFAGRGDDAAALRRARSWWGGQLTSTHDGSSSSAELSGEMWNALYEECPQAEYTGIALEFGTRPPLEVMQALRADHWLACHPGVPAELARQIRQQMREAFYCDTEAWKGQLVSQARQALFQAVDGLAA
ncbi:M14 family metallopeptidase [Ramlibacter sp. 2FC]|uniref:M14 family metallopeptidase n=1 Tax=Ramlibacter sp. 2FC TaxID=2502188 RepID=UPI0010F76552|nr:M14 family metallopeptidase [Ramlibacter sp. 2FC]